MAGCRRPMAPRRVDPGRFRRSERGVTKVSPRLTRIGKSNKLIHLIETTRVSFSGCHRPPARPGAVRARSRGAGPMQHPGRLWGPGRMPYTGTHAGRGQRHPSPLRRRAQDDGVPQAAQADHPPDPRGDRDLRHGAAGRAVAGVPLGRQGQLYAARGADRASVARGPAGRHPRVQSRPGAAGVSGHRPAGVSGADGRAAPDRVPRHLFHRHGQGAGGEDLLRALLPAAARASLPDRAGGRVLVDRARPSPRRHHRDVPAQPLPRRQAGGDAAEAA